jgi:hypothetical protein
MKRTLRLSIATLALGGLMTAPGFAQTSYNRGAHPRVNQVTRREVRQQQRIRQGVRSGELTPREAAHLQRRAARIHRHKRYAMVSHNGHLTRRDQILLNRQQDRLSQEIHAMKHNPRRW